jgi:hypothetical protein
LDESIYFLRLPDLPRAASSEWCLLALKTLAPRDFDVPDFAVTRLRIAAIASPKLVFAAALPPSKDIGRGRTTGAGARCRVNGTRTRRCPAGRFAT